jgi:hypothetical protein
MEQIPTRVVVKIVVITVLVCSFVPGLNRVGPVVLHSAAVGLERTARVADWVSGYERHHHQVEVEEG